MSEANHRFYAWSDVHTDHPDNLSICHQLSYHPNSTLLLAGDISDDLAIIESTLRELKSKFTNVFYTVGNHELWLRGAAREQSTSIDKLQQVEELCSRLGVETSAALVGGHTWVVPLMSWYHADWDTRPDIPGAMAINKIMMDFHLCRWPEHLSSTPSAAAEDDALARFFDGMNNARVQHVLQAQQQQQVRPVVTMSHFLPREHALLVPNLPKASGSRYLAARLQQLHPLVHVFGHTHIARDMVLDGVRYVQQPLDYPKARRKRNQKLLAQGRLPLQFTVQHSLLLTQRCKHVVAFIQLTQRRPRTLCCRICAAKNCVGTKGVGAVKRQ